MKKKWCVECLGAALAVTLFLFGCSSENSGSVVNGGDSSNEGSTEVKPDTQAVQVIEPINAPLYVFEILEEQIAAADSTDSVSVNSILDLLARPRVDQHLMNHVPLDSAVERAKYETLAAFGVDSLQYAMDSNAVLLAISAMMQNRLSKEETQNFIGTLGEDLKGDGVWNDPNWKIQALFRWLTLLKLAPMRMRAR